MNKRGFALTYKFKVGNEKVLVTSNNLIDLVLLAVKYEYQSKNENKNLKIRNEI